MTTQDITFIRFLAIRLKPFRPVVPNRWVATQFWVAGNYFGVAGTYFGVVKTCVIGR